MRFMRFLRPLARFLPAARPLPPAPEDGIAAHDAGPPERIVATALGGGEEALRAAAIRKLPDGESLRTLAGLTGSGSAPPSLERIAQERVAQLVDAKTIDFDALCAAGSSTAVLAVAGLCSDPAHLSRALGLIEDPGSIVRLVIEGSSSRLRQLAAQTLSDPIELKQLLKQVRDKDKSVYKIIKQKCDALRAEEQRIAQIESDVVAACASLERHSHRVYDVIYEPSFRHFHTRWQALEARAAPEVRARAEQAIGRCQEITAEHVRRLAQHAAEEAEQAARKAAREQAIALADIEAQRRDEALARAAAETAANAAAEQDARAQKLAAETLGLRQIGGLMAKAQGALRDGNTGRAAGLRRAIDEKLPAIPALPAHLAKQLLQLDAKLGELKEWKEHAVAPKRALLIEEMESLVGSSEEPRVLADRIKQLQQDWKTISKGIVSDSEADWQRFHRASESAYEPCREYFEAQAKQRAANLQKRKEVLERLVAFEAAQSGERPDSRALAVVLREAPQEWRRCSPVDRAASLTVQNEFEASMRRLQGRLDAWHAQNAADKTSLIQRAQQLRAQDGSREAVDAVKRLQTQWKEVGPCPRDQERALWQEFREQCDAVYQKRELAHAEYSAGLEANKAQAAALCEEAEQAAALSGPALREGAGKIAQWRSAFEALGEMPKGEQRALHDRFERALNHVRTAVSQQRARENTQSFIHLLEAARRIRDYGWAVAQGAASDDRAARKEAAERFIAGVEHWPKGGAEALKQAWARADDAAALDAAAHETALRTLCIRSEILGELSTPPEDQALRRDYQVRRLVQHMGQGRDASVDELDALALEWVCVGPISPETEESLLARFLRSRRER
jgi:Domain of Unknown Function (DUF349)